MEIITLRRSITFSDMNVEIDNYVEQVIYQNVDNLLSQPNCSIVYDFEIDSL